MSFLCGCGNKSGYCSPVRTPTKNTNMSKLKPPSAIPSKASRFGFSNKSQKLANVPSMEMSSTTDQLIDQHTVEVTSQSTGRVTVRPASSALAIGMTLDPSALVSADPADLGTDEHVRRKVTRSEVRPRSLISTISQGRASTPPQVESSRQTLPNTRPSDKSKPQSRLKSLLRPFSKAKLTTKAVNGHVATSNINMNNSRSDSTLSAKVEAMASSPPVGKNAKSINYSNSSSKSNMKKGTSKSSPQLTRTHTTSPSPSTSVHKTEEPSTPPPPPRSGVPSIPQSGLAAVPQSGLAAVPQSGLAAAAAASQKPTKELPKHPKSSRLSYPSVKSVSAADESSISKASHSGYRDQCLPNHVINDPKQSLTNEMNAPLCKEEGVNIDLKRLTEAIEPRRSDTETELGASASTLSSHNTVGTKPAPSSRTSLKTARDFSTLSYSGFMPTAPNAGGGRKKPTIEINPLTKHDNPNGPGSKTDQSAAEEVEMGTLNTKKYAPSSDTSSCGKTYTMDEATMDQIRLEVSSLRQALVELQFHLSGKQEYEEKMREELQLRNDIIANLQTELSQCTCPKKNGYSKQGEGDVPTCPLEKWDKSSSGCNT